MDAFSRRVEAEVIHRLRSQSPAAEAWVLVKLSRGNRIANPDPNLGPAQRRYQAEFHDELNDQVIRVSINFDPESGEFGIVKESSR